MLWIKHYAKKDCKKENAQKQPNTKYNAQLSKSLCNNNTMERSGWLCGWGGSVKELSGKD